MIELEFISSDDQEILGKWSYQKNALVIGRSFRSDIIINDESISPTSLYLKFEKEHLILTNDESLPFYLLNGKKISGARSLKPGQEITVGTTSFKLVNAEPITPKHSGQFIQNKYDKIIEQNPDLANLLELLENELMLLENLEQKSNRP